MKYLFLLVLLFVSSLTYAQRWGRWSENEDFERKLDAVSDPINDRDNFAPLKSQSGDLITMAEAIKNSKTAKDFNSKSFNDKMDNLIAETKSLDKGVKDGATDDNLYRGMRRVHNAYHEAMRIYFGDYYNDNHDDNDDNNNDDRGRDHHDHHR
jgi:hypothetical protein